MVCAKLRLQLNGGGGLSEALEAKYGARLGAATGKCASAHFKLFRSNTLVNASVSLKKRGVIKQEAHIPMVRKIKLIKEEAQAPRREAHSKKSLAPRLTTDGRLQIEACAVDCQRRNECQVLRGRGIEATKG